MSNLSGCITDETPMHNIYNVDPSRAANIAPIRTVPMDPIHPQVKAKKKVVNPEITKAAMASASPKKKKEIEYPSTMKEKTEKLNDYKAKKAQAE